jgi:UDP-N-acetylmuramyl pentapeptide phosphotransferase/UDP-N-acetylglucosamine-1-phosphate transferase
VNTSVAFLICGMLSHHFVLGAFMIMWLLVIFIICAGISLLLCGIAKLLFPKFRSGEHKPGTHRPDLPAGGREIKTFELPLVGGPAITIAIIGTGIGAGYFLHFNPEQWTLLLISLSAAFSYALVGFLDDWRKVYNNEGLSEIAKFGGVFFVSIAAATLYFFLLPYSGQEPYTFWKDLPILNTLLTHLQCGLHNGHPVCIVSLREGPVAYFTWLIFLLLMTGVFGSITSLSVDFSDGLDGLAGGLVFSAAVAFGVVVTGLLNKPEGIVLEVLSLLTAAGTLGFLPWNWPSAWAARKGIAPRRAKIYMGDCGALGLGGLIAMIAIFSRNETLLLIIGGAFVLEGLSALTQSRVMTPLFRSQLQTLRFASSKEFVPHTEFPLPFLATPLHHHFDLLGWDRRRLVYGAWVLGACFAFLGASISLAVFPWERYVVRVLALILAVGVWSSGSWTKCYFVGKHPAERTRRRRLALYYGFPYRIMSIRLYHLVEIIEASEDVIETPAEELALWQRMSIFDARSMLGLYCYRAGYYPAALAQWTRIPERNRVLRPEITHLLADVDSRLAVEQQETQPMRRDAILQQAMFNGKLPLADLPNPYEPVSRPEIGQEDEDDWGSGEDGEDEEEHIATTSLSNEFSNLVSNGHSTTDQLETDQPPVVLGSLQTTRSNSSENQNWFTRLLHFTSPK